jgi:hypothetical protein
VVILLSALAVVVAAVLLVASFLVDGGIGLLWASVAFAVASIVLLWAARWIGSSPTPHGSSEPAPLPPSTPTATSSTPIADDVSVSAGIPEPDDDDEVDDGAVPMFPIAGYDSLWVSQIVPLLGELDADELAVVEARERGGRHRAGVLDAIAEMRTLRGTALHPAPPGAADELWSAPSSALPPPPPPAPPVDVVAEVPAEPEPEVDVDVDVEAESDPVPEATEQEPVDAPTDREDVLPEDAATPDGDQADEAHWDWDAVPRPEPEPVDLTEPEPVIDLDEPAPGPAEAEAAQATDGSGPVVRTFLGRRRSPITVRRG